jgi:NAD(P)H-dependent flavin oxidoreductase YrpB (nitropropane dioxygenase family)
MHSACRAFRMPAHRPGRRCLMATSPPDLDHDCEHGGGAAPGLIPVQRKAASACCAAALTEGGTDAAGHTCTACGQPATRVLGPRTAHWTCLCGQRRQQVITEPEAEAA